MAGHKQNSTRRLDPGLEGRDFAEAAQRLDQMPDRAFTAFGLTRQDVARLRERFAAWPRDAGAADREAGEDIGAGQFAQGTSEEQLNRATYETDARQPGSLRDAPQAEPEEPEMEP